MTNKSEILSAANEIAQPIVAELGFEFIEIEYIKEGAEWYLRIYIDKPGGINIDDCVRVSERVNIELDKNDFGSDKYIFEVSSPGLERPLKTDKDFEKYKGEIVEVSFHSPIDGKNSIDGILKGKKSNILEIESDKGHILEIDIEKVSLVKRAIRF